MAYSLELADRARKMFKGKRNVTEKKMFGGLAFMLKGKMTVGILHDRLVARVNPKDTPKLLEKDGVWPFDFTGTPMKGYLYVGPQAYKTEAQLKAWVERCVEFVSTNVIEKRVQKSNK